MLYITQCHHPLPVAAAEWYIVTANDFVPAGAFAHASAGEMFWPVHPIPLKTWAKVMRPFATKSGAVSLRCPTAICVAFVLAFWAFAACAPAIDAAPSMSAATANDVRGIDIVLLLSVRAKILLSPCRENDSRKHERDEIVGRVDEPELSRLSGKKSGSVTRRRGETEPAH